MAWGPNRVYLLYVHRRPRSQSELTEVRGLFRAEVSQDQPPLRGEKGRTGEYTVALRLLAKLPPARYWLRVQLPSDRWAQGTSNYPGQPDTRGCLRKQVLE